MNVWADRDMAFGLSETQKVVAVQRRRVKQSQKFRGFVVTLLAFSACFVVILYSCLPTSLFIAPGGGIDADAGERPVVSLSRVEGSLPAVERRRLVGLVGSSSAAGLLNSAEAGALAKDPEEKQGARIFATTTAGVVSVARKPKPGEKPRTQDGLPPALGSGFVWQSQSGPNTSGLIVTNWHVVKDVVNDILIIYLGPAGRRAEDEPPVREILEGVLVGKDPATDVAVVRVVAKTDREKKFAETRPLMRGNSSELDVGQTVYAIGNPFGLEHSMSRGIIAGISRTLDIGDRPIRGCIQTDASINPGNSGGPLLDSQGQVIGVNTAILTSTGNSAGVGLAIPIDAIARNVEKIMKQGFVPRAFLGITFAQDVISQSLQQPGIIVVSVVPGSPAEKAGVRPSYPGLLGDIVTGLNNQTVRTGADFFKQLDKYAPNTTVPLTVQRGKRGENGTYVVEETELNITLGLSGAPGAANPFANLQKP